MHWLLGIPISGIDSNLNSVVPKTFRSMNLIAFFLRTNGFLEALKNLSGSFELFEKPSGSWEPLEPPLTRPLQYLTA